MNLSSQVMKFTQNKNRWTDKELSEAIYLTYIGSDDYLNFVKNHPNPSHEQKQAFVDQVITSIEAAIKVIYEAGGRKFTFQNLAPLGCLPIVKQESENEDNCIKLPSEMAALHNKNLLKLMEKLSQDLNSFHYLFYDFFSSIQNRVLKPQTYTFRTGTAACCGIGSLNVCTNPKEYVFFDGKYLTQEANFQVAHLIWNAHHSQVIGHKNLRELLLFPLDTFAVSSSQDKIQASSYVI